jgi:hypothetical protein
MHHPYNPPSSQTAAPARVSLEGLWVVLVNNDGQLAAADPDGRVPVMAQAGDGHAYLLAFKNAARARQFVTAQELDGAEPRMVLRTYKETLLRVARGGGAVGMLVDYDPSTQQQAVAVDLA